jgi:hypothetical protein
MTQDITNWGLEQYFDILWELYCLFHMSYLSLPKTIGYIGVIIIFYTVKLLNYL